MSGNLCLATSRSGSPDPSDDGRRGASGSVRTKPHLLCVGGEDHHLRIPFMLAMRDHGFRVSAAATGDPDPFVSAGIDYYPFRFERFVNPLADWDAIRALKTLLRGLRPDIVQSFDTKPSVLVPLAARDLSDVLVVRTITGLGWIYASRSPLAATLRPIHQGLARLGSRSTAMTVFENHEDQALFERHRLLEGCSSEVIPASFIDIEGFERALAVAASPAQLRSELGLGTSEVVITVTRMTRQKGIPTLLKAAALVHQARPDVRFLLVGPRESEGPLAVAQADIDRHAAYVTAIGQRSDIPALLRLADLFAFPTEYREGLPRVLLEAALAELPIVSTSMPGCGDVIRDSWSGFLVPPRSPDMLAAKIVDLLRDRQAARTMAGRAAQLVRQEFSLQQVVGRYAALFSELLDRSTRDRARTARRPRLEREPG
jgi:glycosyltransferase involved in cell wall biosynthesis